MTKEAKAAAIEKYAEFAKDKPNEVVIAKLIEDAYEPKEAQEIAIAITKHLQAANEPPKQEEQAAKPAAKSIAQQQAEHPTMKWFDEFQAVIMKIQKRNVIANRMDTIITGWELRKKLHPKFIEPNVAKELNHFADSFDSENGGKLLLLQSKAHKPGDVIEYKEWFKETGRDAREDVNSALLEAYVYPRKD